MKKFLIISGIILVVILVLIYLLISNIGPIIKQAINTYGSQLTKTEVHVDNVSVSIFSGSATIEGFFLGNPSGFSSHSAISVKSIYVELDERSIASDPVVIDRIEVIEPDITYEKKDSTDNFKEIINNLQKTAGDWKLSEKVNKKAEEKNNKKILIRDFVLSNGKANLDFTISGEKKREVMLLDIHLKDLGEEAGMAPAVIFKKIMESLYKNISGNTISKDLNEDVKTINK